jgi:hypothetical protein
MVYYLFSFLYSLNIMFSRLSRFDQNVLYDRLQGHYGEIAMNPSGSFLAEKCFTASNFSHKEAIVIVDRAK